MSTNLKKILQITGLSVFFLLIIIYAFSRSQDLIFGIQIKNVNINGKPAEKQTAIKDAVLEITGNAKNATKLVLDGREISIDESGNFNETIALLQGYNIMNITAKDKFGYLDEKNYKLIYEAGNTF